LPSPLFVQILVSLVQSDKCTAHQTRLKRCPAETLSPAISILEESFNCDSVMKPLEIKSVQRPGWEIVFRQARIPDDEIKINVDLSRVACQALTNNAVTAETRLPSAPRSAKSFVARCTTDSI